MCHDPSLISELVPTQVMLPHIITRIPFVAYTLKRSSSKGNQQMAQLQCDYCGLKLNRVYIRRQLVKQDHGREQPLDDDGGGGWTDRFCDNDCLVRWVQRGMSRLGANLNLQFAELAREMNENNKGE